MFPAFPVSDCSPGSSRAGGVAGLEADAFTTLPASGAVEAAARASRIGASDVEVWRALRVAKPRLRVAVLRFHGWIHTLTPQLSACIIHSCAKGWIHGKHLEIHARTATESLGFLSFPLPMRSCVFSSQVVSGW